LSSLVLLKYKSCLLTLLRVLIHNTKVLMYINIRLIKLCFSLWKDILNHKNINLIFFFNYGTICFIINVYSDNQQSASKYLKNTEVNLNNILIMIGDFNIRDNNWNPLHLYHLIYMNISREIVGSFNLKLPMSIDQVFTYYTNSPQDLNSVLYLMFLHVNVEEFNNHMISPNL